MEKHTKHNIYIKFCKCTKCISILIRHILNMCDEKIKKLQFKLSCKKRHKSI